MPCLFKNTQFLSRTSNFYYIDPDYNTYTRNEVIQGSNETQTLVNGVSEIKCRNIGHQEAQNVQDAFPEVHQFPL